MDINWLYHFSCEKTLRFDFKLCLRAIWPAVEYLISHHKRCMVGSKLVTCGYMLASIRRKRSFICHQTSQTTLLNNKNILWCRSSTCEMLVPNWYYTPAWASIPFNIYYFPKQSCRDDFVRMLLGVSCLQANKFSTSHVVWQSIQKCVWPLANRSWLARQKGLCQVVCQGKYLSRWGLTPCPLGTDPTPTFLSCVPTTVHLCYQSIHTG